MSPKKETKDKSPERIKVFTKFHVFHIPLIFGFLLQKAFQKVRSHDDLRSSLEIHWTEEIQTL